LDTNGGNLLLTEGEIKADTVTLHTINDEKTFGSISGGLIEAATVNIEAYTIGLKIGNDIKGDPVKINSDVLDLTLYGTGDGNELIYSGKLDAEFKTLPTLEGDAVDSIVDYSNYTYGLEGAKEEQNESSTAVARQEMINKLIKILRKRAEIFKATNVDPSIKMPDILEYRCVPDAGSQR